MPDSPLRYATPAAWTDAVMADFDSFLLDHATAEKKASGMAISMLSHYPDRMELVAAMADLAVEELTHYREVVKWIHQRGLTDRAGPARIPTWWPFANRFARAARSTCWTAC